MRGVVVTSARGLKPTVHGVGFTDALTSTGVGRKTSYYVWKGMLKRCYVREQRSVAYVGCSVCPEWLFYSAFDTWFEKYRVPGHHLDKDILVSGNKEYGPHTCCFVPIALNSLLTSRQNQRGAWPQGVDHMRRSNGSYRFRASLNYDGVQRNLGEFLTPELAAAAYVEAKAERIHDVAWDYYNANLITLPVRDALLRIARDRSFIQDGV